MTHVRKQIRDAIVAELTGLSTTGSNVYGGRSQTVAKAKLPALFIFATEETSAIDAMGRPRPYIREVMVHIEMAVAASANVEDNIDQICLEIELAMGADNTFGSLAKRSELRATSIEFDESGDQPLAGARLEYAVQYRTREDDPETAL